MALADEWEALCFRDSEEMARACRVRAERLVANKRALEKAERRKHEAEETERKKQVKSSLRVLENCIARCKKDTHEVIAAEGTDVDWAKLKGV